LPAAEAYSGNAPSTPKESANANNTVRISDFFMKESPVEA
jgi:hypothetical protein